MAKVSLNDQEALSICRTPKPTTGDMKKVLAWAEAAPSVDKVAPLLLLQTGNYASRKDLDGPFQQSLVKCAEADPTSLWETVEGDWDPYRVLHALRALATIDGEPTLRRLIELGKMKILRIHWGAIEEAARAKGVPIPDEVIQVQRAMDAQRGSGDFHDVFQARKASWPADRDQSTAAQEGEPRATAAKGPRKQGEVESPAFPEVFSREGEPNEFLGQYKASRKDRWTLTRMEGLFEEVDLAFFLAALGREDEALRVVSFLADHVRFSGNYNVWTPVAYGIALQTRLYRIRGDSSAAQTALERLREHPFQAPMPRDVVLGKVQGFAGELAKAAREKSPRNACRELARALCGICFYRETGAEGFRHSGWYATEDLETLMADGLRLLRDRL